MLVTPGPMDQNKNLMLVIGAILFKVKFSLLILQAYWGRGYAFPITYEQSCIVLEEFFKQMDSAKSVKESGDR